MHIKHTTISLLISGVSTGTLATDEVGNPDEADEIARMRRSKAVCETTRLGNHLSAISREVRDQVAQQRSTHHFLLEQLDDHVRRHVTAPHDLLKATASLRLPESTSDRGISGDETSCEPYLVASRG